jgi:hypothetical protein
VAGKYGLNCLEKRDLLNEAVVSRDALLSWGKHYEDANSLCDAVDFYEKSGAVDALVQLRSKVSKTGNVFLFRRICRIVGREPDRDEWLSIADSARELGKLAFAAEARLLAGVEDVPEDIAP